MRNRRRHCGWGGEIHEDARSEPNRIRSKSEFVTERSRGRTREAVGSEGKLYVVCSMRCPSVGRVLFTRSLGKYYIRFARAFLRALLV